MRGTWAIGASGDGERAPYGRADDASADSCIDLHRSASICIDQERPAGTPSTLPETVPLLEHQFESVHPNGRPAAVRATDFRGGMIGRARPPTGRTVRMTEPARRP